MIVVVGAGITGLAIGHELLESGVDFIILEASDRVGGVVQSGKVGEHVLDW
ncbi:MAG TPA: protoporphyrinogen oxidase, partial [Gemmatimonadetes bacterium]|nr:protoporphyrinogen oxidase [Gemmatimonadota bacterium]